MKKLTLQSNAKVNLSLDILGVEKAAGPFEGYHFIQTVLCEITPQNCSNFAPDLVTIEEIAKDLSDLNKSNPQRSLEKPQPLGGIPGGPQKTSNLRGPNNENLAYKALEIIKKAGHDIPPTKITIEKSIPLSSGLGGGSSNAATVIKGLNHMWGLNLTPQEMRELAAKIGMDVPFFISGGLALAEHYGEQITQLPPVHGLAFTLFPGSASISTSVSNDPEKTKNAYASLDLSKCGKNHEKTEALIHAIKTNDLYELHQNLHNDFETSLKEPLPRNHHLSGAGPTQFVMA